MACEEATRSGARTTNQCGSVLVAGPDSSLIASISGRLQLNIYLNATIIRSSSFCEPPILIGIRNKVRIPSTGTRKYTVLIRLKQSHYYVLVLGFKQKPGAYVGRERTNLNVRLTRKVLLVPLWGTLLWYCTYRTNPATVGPSSPTFK